MTDKKYWILEYQTLDDEWIVHASLWKLEKKAIEQANDGIEKALENAPDWPIKDWRIKKVTVTTELVEKPKGDRFYK